MRLTVIGSGDAFGSGGRFNTCFHVAAARSTVLIDCGASSMVALRVAGVDPNGIDGIILSHLHGDHFGGLPFFLLDAQYVSRRERPLLIAGPPGTRARVSTLLETMFPRLESGTKWRFPWEVTEVAVAAPTELLGFTVTSAEVIHFSGAPSTALRVTDGSKTLAYSGDTQWTDALLPIASGADLFIVECCEYERELSGHLNWKTARARMSDFAARRVMVTHMSASVLGRLDEIAASGVLVAADGLVVDL
jgi:ribonuclease BN (tRNA processing enzyme)